MGYDNLEQLSRRNSLRGRSPACFHSDQLGWFNAAEHDQLHVPLPEGREGGRKWLKSMARVSLMDGTLHPDELQLLVEVGSKYDLAGHDVKLLVKQTRTELYTQARDTLRQQRRSATSNQAS